MVPTDEASFNGWENGASRRFVSLAGARAVTQVVSLAWFLLMARLMSEFEFGQVVTGLAFFALFAGLGDLGTTRTIVRFVAADHRTLWPAYTRTLQIRIAGGLVVGGSGTLLIWALPVPVDPIIVLLAGAIAVVSGATELGYAALRSIGRTSTELLLLPLERGVFLVLGIVLIERGFGAEAVLCAYLLTNLISAVFVGRAVYRIRPLHAHQPGDVLDREGRKTAAAFALLTVSPRVAPVLLSLLASAAAVAQFSVAQRPIEAMTLFALSTAAPVLPIVRSRLARGDRERGERAASGAAAAIVVAVAPIVVWCIVCPDVVLNALFGTGRYDVSNVALSLLSVTAITWTIRGVGELLLLAEERAGRALAVTGIGTASAIVLGVPGVLVWGVNGAAGSVLISELVMTALLAFALPRLVDRTSLQRFLPAIFVGFVALVALGVAPKTIGWSIVVLVPLVAVALSLALLLVKHLDPRPV